jgi:hypothetical protein
LATEYAVTLDANGEIAGPVVCGSDNRLSFHVVITGTITVTVQRSIGDSGFVTTTKPDGSTAAVYTASCDGVIDAPGSYQIVASGVSGGNAICYMLTHR